MNITDEKGFIFSTDLLFSFLLISSMFFLILLNINSIVEKRTGNLKEFELKKNAVLLMDSLVKNLDEEKAILGSAEFDALKRRVKSNELNEKQLERIAGFESDEFFIKSVSVIFKSGQEKIYFNGIEGKNCFSLNRFVLLNGEKAKVKAVVCNE